MSPILGPTIFVVSPPAKFPEHFRIVSCVLDSSSVLRVGIGLNIGSSYVMGPTRILVWICLLFGLPETLTVAHTSHIPQNDFVVCLQPIWYSTGTFSWWLLVALAG